MFGKATLVIAQAAVFSAVAALFAGCSHSTDALIVKAEQNQLTFVEPGRPGEMTSQVSPDVNVTLDGKPGQLEDLDEGDRAWLTREGKAEQSLITSIVATSEERAADRVSPTGAMDSPAIETSVPWYGDEPLSAPVVGVGTAPRTYEGSVVGVGDQELILANDNAEQQMFTVTPDTDITLNGEGAQLSDLGEGDSATISAESGGEVRVATSIDARQVR
jgi:hypothetical protein